MHTAVKVVPRYDYPAVHVLDASRAVVVAASLLDPVSSQEYAEEISELYDEMREDYLEGLAERKYLKLNQARSKQLRIDFKTLPPPVPLQPGIQVLTNVDLASLVPFIDWNPFFQTWQLRGKYPNRKYPNIFKDKTVGAEAKKLFDASQTMLSEIIERKTLTAKAVVGIFPANSVGDDIVVYTDEDRKTEKAKFFTLRQQAEHDFKEYRALSDYIAPKESGIPDYIGMFVTTAGFGTKALCDAYEADHDDYKSIMVKALADRLAEAFAEKMHQDMRKTYWGYAPDEKFNASELHSVKYQGIRPAPGYPSQPDHTEMKTLWSLLDVEANTGVQLSPSMAMMPAASVSALCFGHPKAQYFAVGKMQKDQVTEYAQRKSWTTQNAEKWLNANLAYDRDE